MDKDWPVPYCLLFEGRLSTWRDEWNLISGSSPAAVTRELKGWLKGYVLPALQYREEHWFEICFEELTGKFFDHSNEQDWRPSSHETLAALERAMETHAAWLEAPDGDGTVLGGWYTEFLSMFQECWMLEDGILVFAEGWLPTFVAEFTSQLRYKSEEGEATLIHLGGLFAQLAKLPPPDSKDWAARGVQLEALRLMREICDAL